MLSNKTKETKKINLLDIIVLLQKSKKITRFGHTPKSRPLGIAFNKHQQPHLDQTAFPSKNTIISSASLRFHLTPRCFVFAKQNGGGLATLLLQSLVSTRPPYLAPQSTGCLSANALRQKQRGPSKSCLMVPVLSVDTTEYRQSTSYLNRRAADSSCRRNQGQSY